MPKRATRALDLGFDSEPTQTPGLTRLFAASTSKESEMQRATMVEVDHLGDNPFQPRLDMDEQSLEELAHVIKLQGFQGVLVARPVLDREGYYQLTAGHRRREAARRAGLRVLPIVVQDLSDEEMVVRAITENIQREDLSPLEEGKIYLLMSEEMSYTYQQIAKEVGKTVSYIRNRLGVARAPEDVQNLVQKKPDTLRAVIYLSKVEDGRVRTEIIEQILAGSLTTDDLPAYIEALQAEVPAPLQVQLVSVDAPADGGTNLTTSEESLAEPNVAPGSKPKEVEPTNSQAIPTLAEQMVPEIIEAGPVPAKRVVQIDGVATPVEQPPKPLIGRPPLEDERTQLRVRGSKLTSIVRTLVTYENMLAGGPSLSPDEIGRLSRISAVVEGLLARSNSDVQNKGAEK